MAQMRVTAPAGNGVAPHPKAPIGTLDHVHRRNGLPEARPTGAGFELRLRVVQCRGATNAAVDAVRMILGVLARKCRLGTVPTRDDVGLGRKLRAPLGIALDDLGGAYDAFTLAGRREILD